MPITFDSHGPEIEQVYDDMERMITRIVSDGSTQQTTHFTYDTQDRLLMVKDALNRVTAFVYDPIKVRKQPTSIVDPAGRATHFEYDARDRLVKMTDARGAQTKFTYDHRGNLTAVTDAEP